MDQYTYDAWNRLVKVQKAYRVATSDGQGGVTLGAVQLGSVVSEMRYDGLGRRIEKKIENSANLDCTYDYYYDGQHLIQTYDGSNTLIKQYVWGNAAGGYVDDLVWIGSSDVDDGTIDIYDWVLQGPNYDVRGVIDSAGDLVERYTYTPYGQRRVFTSAGTNDGGLHARALMSQRVNVLDIPQPYALNPFGHQGLMHDETLGLIYNRAREYDPTLGRFMQRDPLGRAFDLMFNHGITFNFKTKPSSSAHDISEMIIARRRSNEYFDGMNLYLYLQANPKSWTDSLGLCPCNKCDHWTWKIKAVVSAGELVGAIVIGSTLTASHNCNMKDYSTKYTFAGMGAGFDGGGPSFSLSGPTVHITTKCIGWNAFNGVGSVTSLFGISFMWWGYGVMHVESPQKSVWIHGGAKGASVSVATVYVGKWSI